VSSRGRTFNPSVSQAYRARSSGVGGARFDGSGGGHRARRRGGGRGRGRGRWRARARTRRARLLRRCRWTRRRRPSPFRGSARARRTRWRGVTTRTALHHPALIDRIMPLDIGAGARIVTSGSARRAGPAGTRRVGSSLSSRADRPVVRVSRARSAGDPSPAARGELAAGSPVTRCAGDSPRESQAQRPRRAYGSPQPPCARKPRHHQAAWWRGRSRCRCRCRCR
jgi:hypothetical protein